MALHELCMERKAANLERWRKYGNNLCGLSEAVIRGAVTPGQEEGEQSAAVENDVAKEAVAPVADGEKAAVEVPVAEMDGLKVVESKEEAFVDAPVASLDKVAEAAPAVHA